MNDRDWDKSIYEMADSLAKKMAKDEKFMTAWGDYCDKEDFKSLASQVWGKIAAIAAPRFGCMMISVIDQDSFGYDVWSFVIIPFSVGASGDTSYFRTHFPCFYEGPLEDYLDMVYEDWKDLEKEGYVEKNYSYKADYFVPVDGFEGL